MSPLIIAYIEAHAIIQLALWALLPLLLAAICQRHLPFLASMLQIIGTLGLFVAMALAVAQFLHIDTGFNALSGSSPEQTMTGTATRIRLGPDGHFWVQARANGTTRRLLVDTGATLTTLTAEAADDMGAIPDPDGNRILLTTANGQTEAQLGIIPSLRVGNVVVRNLPIAVAPGIAETNVLGMNFLSMLAGWRVEGKTLILVPHHPQLPATADSSA